MPNYNPHYYKDVDAVDAMAFSGDALYDKETREHFKATLARWQRRVEEIERCEKEEKEDEKGEDDEL